MALLLALCAVIVIAPASVSASVTPIAARYPKAEAYLLRLINCTRTGGWVRMDGSCDDYGSGLHSKYREPLVRNAGISRLVTRPYARLMARRDVMSHDLDGDLAFRLRRAGYDYSECGENIGWSAARPHNAVLFVHRLMQNEKSYNGPHWRNIKTRAFTSVGIGVWRAHGHTYLATDYHAP